MKRIFAILMALMMVLVSAAALATEPESADPPANTALNTASWTSDEFTFSGAGSFSKVYDDADTGILPDETLQFVATPDGSNPDDTNIAVEGYKATAKEGNLTITVPSYSKVGVYKYTIAETAGSSQGVTYSTDTVGLTVLVEYDYTNKKLRLATVGITKNASGQKEDTFTNKYEVGDLTVTKSVTGNLGDLDQYFDVTVTLTAEKTVNSDITVTGGTDATATNVTVDKGWTGEKAVNIKIKSGETVTIQNVPKGVTYTVAEAAAHAAADANGADGSKGYTVTYKGDNGTITAGTVASEITNDKSMTVDTGITLETLPYVMLMALAVLGFVALKLRRREEN